MKRNIIFLSLVAVLVVTMSLAYGGVKGSMSISIPFEFYVQDQLMPAGEYRFEIGSVAMSPVVAVRTSEGEGIRFLLTRLEANTISNPSYLRFNQYDEKRFLSSVSIGDSKARVSMSKLERELQIAKKVSQTETLIAQK